MLDRVLGLGVPRDATISYRLPNVVVVAVRERTMEYGWKVGDTTLGVSDDGVILGPTTDTIPRLVVEDRRAIVVRPGDRIDPTVLREADYLALNVPRLISTPSMTIDYADDLGVVVAVPKQATIVIGDDHLLDQKLAALSPVWSAAVSQRPPANVVDLRVPSRPFLR
jgi:hypothetical protein